MTSTLPAPSLTRQSYLNLGAETLGADSRNTTGPNALTGVFDRGCSSMVTAMISGWFLQEFEKSSELLQEEFALLHKSMHRVDYSPDFSLADCMMASVRSST